MICEPSDSMPSWPDDNECLRQRLLAMSLQCVVELAVNGVPVYQAPYADKAPVHVADSETQYDQNPGPW